jgi:(1->4)-alpha-D-glucan 1-alpha-D-glucosylmutase
LNVLSEVPEEWEARLARWQAFNAETRSELDGEAVPDANEEHLIYQTLVGTWPIEPLDTDGQAVYIERIVRYLDKALREAKLHTSWLNPYEEYDQAVAGFIRAILADWQSPFVKDLDDFVRSISDAGFVNSLAQTLIKTCAPGVPDFYQGVEFWDFNLVDPDNRRPVDFAVRRRALAELAARAKESPAALAAELLRGWPDERIKLFVIWRGLALRKTRAELISGRYEPLTVDGPRKNNVCAFARVEGPHWTVCIVPRFTCEAQRALSGKPSRVKDAEPRWPLADWWHETSVELPSEAPARFAHELTGAVLDAARGSEGTRLLDVGRILATFPVALATGKSK